jgi:hypothetical protein
MSYEHYSVNGYSEPERKKGGRFKKLLISLAVLFFLGTCSSGVKSHQIDPIKIQEGLNTAAAKAADTTEDANSVSESQAVEAAQQYVDSMGFSKAGLMQQLTSKSGSQFSKEDAKYAIKHIDVNWNDEAAEAAQSYLDTMAFSRNELIEQLTSKAGSQFTRKQAEYGAKKVGLGKPVAKKAPVKQKAKAPEITGVHPGAFCQTNGAVGIGTNGNTYTCKGPGQDRWRR